MSNKVKSDGGSSSYYQLTIVNRKTGEKFECEMGDIIASIYDNDFDMGNIAKAMRRISQDRKGKGKDGASAKYDAKKCTYFSGILEQVAALAEREGQAELEESLKKTVVDGLMPRNILWPSIPTQSELQDAIRYGMERHFGNYATNTQTTGAL